MTIACGNKVHKNFAVELERVQAHHGSVAEARLCFAREGGVRSIEENELLAYWEYVDEQEAQAEYEAEMGYERYLENRGWEEAELERRMEAERGVIPFDVAMAAAEREARA